MIDHRSAIRKYLDHFWKENITLKKITSVSDIDKAIHHLIHNMLVLANDDP